MTPEEFEQNKEDINSFLSSAEYHLEEASDNLEGLLIPGNEIEMHPLYALTFKEYCLQVRRIRDRLEELRRRIMNTGGLV